VEVLGCWIGAHGAIDHWHQSCLVLGVVLLYNAAGNARRLAAMGRRSSVFRACRELDRFFVGAWAICCGLLAIIDHAWFDVVVAAYHLLYVIVMTQEIDTTQTTLTCMYRFNDDCISLALSLSLARSLVLCSYDQIRSTPYTLKCWRFYCCHHWQSRR
jgi:hypothetical protein